MTSQIHILMTVIAVAAAHAPAAAVAQQSTSEQPASHKQPASAKQPAKNKQPEEPTKKAGNKSGPAKSAKSSKKGEGDASGKTTPTARPLPDLDELLGLPAKQQQGAAEKNAPQGQRPAPPVDPNKDELQRALEGQSVAEAFVEAVQEMGDVATLLREARNPGLITQRKQEEILRRLDMLIKQAEQQQQQRRQRQRQQQRQQQQAQQQQAPAQPQQAAQREQAGKGDNVDERMPPPPQDARFAGWLEQAKARWGALPARLRDALLQGSGDAYSSLYEALTREYYRRLAEQEAGGGGS